MSFDKEEFEEAEKELRRIVDDSSVLDEEYTNVSEQLNRDPDQLIWSYIYRNLTGSLRRELADNPPRTFPTWLKELFREEYSDVDGDLPADDFINKALEHLVRRRITA